MKLSRCPTNYFLFISYSTYQALAATKNMKAYKGEIKMDKTAYYDILAYTVNKVTVAYANSKVY